ncbi:MAG: HD domain-containing phosphohydrolase [Burkholderiales bacterium]|nr:HD domain-containing phosphohydrolase [Burkholderiales bacterium]
MQSAYRENTTLLQNLYRPVILPPELIGQAAPCDIFSARGALVVKTGSVISQRAHELMQPQHIYCQAEQAHHISTFDPIEELKRVSLALADLSERAVRGTLVTSDELIALARQVLEVWFLDADACLGFARLSKFGAPSVCHEIHTALLAAELASAHGFKHDMIENVIGAALTMNLAKLALHDEMFNLEGYPSTDMRQEMRTHPTESALILRGIGKLSEHWIDAVASHHENINGSGYPAGLKGTSIALPARMLRVADTLAARLTGRKVRPPQHCNMHYARGDINHWVTHVFGADLSRLDSSLCHTLLRVLSRFPPGSLVRLSNNELAVVTRRMPDQTSTPRTVYAVSDTHGKPLPTPCVRRIRARDCEIRAYAHDALPKLIGVDWQKAWGYGY